VCILLALGREADGRSLWIAANRDEHLERPWQPPRLLAEGPRVFGGRDLVGGGSWLAVNLDAGFVIGVTNARLGAAPRQKSRGPLVLELASARSIRDAVALLSNVEWLRYGALNLLLADAGGAWVATNHPEPSVRRTETSVIALGNDTFAAPGGRVEAAAERARSLAGLGDAALPDALRALLADHGGTDPLCRHGERYGTVCSTVLALRGREVATYLFAPGKPCVTRFEDVTPLVA